MDELPLCRNRLDVEAHDGRVVRIVGVYTVRNLAPYRMVQEMPDGRVVTSSRVVALILDDGTTVDLGIRPAEEMKALEGQRVAAVGKVLAHPPRGPAHMAQPGSIPTLVEIGEVSSTDL